MVKIKEIDGIPCIELSDDVFGIKNSSKKEPGSFITYKDFTDIQQSKEKSDLRGTLRELKKKFEDKE